MQIWVPPPCDDVQKIIQPRIEENRIKIKEVMKLQGCMEQVLERWQHMPNGIPDGHSVCHLIKSIEDDEIEEHCQAES